MHKNLSEYSRFFFETVGLNPLSVFIQQVNFQTGSKQYGFESSNASKFNASGLWTFTDKL